MRIRGFIRVLHAIEPRLTDLVIVGGWAWYLYRKYLTTEPIPKEDFTLDVDIALPRHLPLGKARLDELLSAADFESEMMGEERPPITKHAWPSADRPQAIVEFLTPARGSGSDATLEVGGVVAQQLRFIDLLLHDPMSLTVREREGAERYEGVVRVPRVGLFVWQKALTFRRRQHGENRRKDLLYIFDLVDESRDLLSRIEKDIRAFPVAERRNWRRKAAEALVTECGEVDSGGIGAVLSQIPAENRPSRRYVYDSFQSLIRVLES